MPFKFKKTQKLTPVNKELGITFCHWILSQEAGWERRVIFSDEKIFVLHQPPNHQNDRFWAPRDPQEEIECNIRFDSRAMAWSALVDDRVLQIRWMDEPHRPRNVTAASQEGVGRFQEKNVGLRCNVGLLKATRCYYVLNVSGV